MTLKGGRLRAGSAMVFVITLIAAMLLGIGFVLQQHAAEQAPKSSFLRLRLLADLLPKRRWLAGVAVMVAGNLLSAWAVGHSELSLAEPLLTSSLLFALVLAVPLSGEPLRKVEIFGAVILSAGVACLSVAVSTTSPGVSFGSFAYWPAAAAVAVVAFAFVRAGRRRAGPQRAMLTATGSGLVFGITDALTRRTVQIIDTHSFAALLTSWPAYSLAAASLIGLWLMESAFNAGPLHASLPAITAAEPVAGIFLGVVVFGDVIHISPLMLALQAAGLIALFAGVVIVARAPVLSGLRPRHQIGVHIPTIRPARRAGRRAAGAADGPAARGRSVP